MKEDFIMCQPKTILAEFLIAENAPLPTGGVSHWSLWEDETLTVSDTRIPMDNPMWIEVTGDRLGAVLMSATEHYAAYSLRTGEKITNDIPAIDNDICRFIGDGYDIPTLGSVVCHFTGDGDDLYFANYGGGVWDGNVARASSDTVTRVDHAMAHRDVPLGPNKNRQERPHVHHCLLSPDKKYVLVCDLGLDSVFVYDRSLNCVSRASVPPGHGARHSVFSPDGTRLYTLSEMGGTVTAFRWNDGILTDPVTVDVKPAGREGEHCDSAAIVLSADGRHLYATNRFINTICHCIIGNDGLPVPVSQTNCDGDHPRDFRLIANGRYAVCTNTFSDTLTLYRVEADGELTPLTTVPAGKKPLCIQECEPGIFRNISTDAYAESEGCVLTAQNR